MGLQLITIGITRPLQINHDLGLGDSGDKLLMLLNQDVQFVELVLPLVLGPLSHKDLQEVGQPLLHLSTLQVFAECLTTDV